MRDRRKIHRLVVSAVVQFDQIRIYPECGTFHLSGLRYTRFPWRVTCAHCRKRRPWWRHR